MRISSTNRYTNPAFGTAKIRRFLNSPNFFSHSAKKLFHPVRRVVVENVALGLADPLLLLQFDVLLDHVEGQAPAKVLLDHGIRHFHEQRIEKLKLRIALRQEAHQLQRVQQRMVLHARLEHDLVAVAALAGVAARGRREGARAHHHAGRRGQEAHVAALDEGRAEVLVRPRRADGRGDGRIVPEAAAGIHLAGEHPRDVGSRRDGPGQQVLADVGDEGGNDVQGEFRPDLAAPQVAQLAEREAVAMRHLGRPDVGLHGGHRPLDHAAGGVDVVHDEDRRTLVHARAHRQQTHHVAGVVEVARAHVLDLHHHGVQPLQLVGAEVDVVGVGRQLGFARGEDTLQVPAFAENVIQVAPARGIPAVLRAEARDAALAQAPVELLVDRRGAEGEHGLGADDALRQRDDLLAEALRLLLGLRLGVDADDRLGVGLAQVDPGLVGLEVDLDAVDGVHLLILELLLHRIEDAVDHGRVAEVDAVLGDEVRRERGLVGAHAQALMGQVAEEEGHAHHGVAAAVAGGIDHAAVAFAADQRVHGMHLRGHVHLAHRGGVVGAAVGLRHVAQGAAGAEVGNRIARRHARLFRPLEQIVGHGHEGVFFDERLAVLADECEAVHVRVDADAQVGLLADDRLAQLDEVLRQRLGVVGEVARGLAVEGDAFHAEALQQARHDDAAHGVDGVEHHLEAGLADRFRVHGLQGQDGVDVLVGEVMLLDAAQLVHRGEVEVARFREVQDGLAFGRGEEFAVLVEQLEGVPLARVVAGGQDDAAVCAGEADGQLRGRGGGEAALHHVHAAGHEGAADELLDHRAAEARVAADDHLVALAAVRGGLAHLQARTVCIGELNDIDGGQGLAGGTADGAADAGNGFNQCHSLQNYENYSYLCARFKKH